MCSLDIADFAEARANLIKYFRKQWICAMCDDSRFSTIFKSIVNNNSIAMILCKLRTATGADFYVSRINFISIFTANGAIADH